MTQIKSFLLLCGLLIGQAGQCAIQCDSIFNTEKEMIVHGVAGRARPLSTLYRMKEKGNLIMYRGVSKDPSDPQFKLDHASHDGFIWFSPNRDYALEYAIGQYQTRKERNDKNRLSLLFEYEVPFSQIYWFHKESEMKEVTNEELEQYEFEAVTPAGDDPKRFLKKIYVIDSDGNIVDTLWEKKSKPRKKSSP